MTIQLGGVTVSGPIMEQIYAGMNEVRHVSNGYEPNCVPFRNEGRGYRDMRPNFITDDDVFLDGFSENGVTYESHQFWVRFTKGYSDRFSASIFVKHGGGVESLGVEYMNALPLKTLIDHGELRAAFRLCWGLIDLARSSRSAGSQETRDSVYRAFVEGRLKKRKQRGGDSYKVFIEPETKEINK